MFSLDIDEIGPRVNGNGSKGWDIGSVNTASTATKRSHQADREIADIDQPEPAPY